MSSLVDIDFSTYFSWAEKRNVRKSHNIQLKEVFARTDVFKYSYVPQTVKDWNELPDDIVSSESLSSFKTRLAEYLLSSHKNNCNVCSNL